MFGAAAAVLKTCTPLNKVVLALDGPAPLAKVKTQKSRRQVHYHHNWCTIQSPHALIFLFLFVSGGFFCVFFFVQAFTHTYRAVG
jgi:hypothetical protein